MTHRYRLLCSSLAAVFFCTVPVRAQVVFADGFEAGYEGWSMTGQFHALAATDPCGAFAAPFPTGVQAVRFGYEGFCQGFDGAGDLTLLSPISIPATSDDVKLRFWSYDEVECLSCEWDWRFVYVRVVGTTTWDFLGESTSYYEWKQTELDLNAYKGQELELRLHFDAVDAFGNFGVGWVIDEVRVELETPEPAIYCTPKLSSDGCLATIGASGTAGYSATAPFLVTASDVSEFKNGLFFYGLGASPFPFEGGWFCIQPPTTRTPLQPSGSSGTPCSGAFSLDFNDYLQTTAPPFLAPGDHVFGQYWLRDPGDPFGSVRTNAVEFVLTP